MEKVEQPAFFIRVPTFYKFFQEEGDIGGTFRNSFFCLGELSAQRVDFDVAGAGNFVEIEVFKCEAVSVIESADGVMERSNAANAAGARDHVAYRRLLNVEVFRSAEEGHDGGVFAGDGISGKVQNR